MRAPTIKGALEEVDLSFERLLKVGIKPRFTRLQNLAPTVEAVFSRDDQLSILKSETRDQDLILPCANETRMPVADLNTDPGIAVTMALQQRRSLTFKEDHQRELIREEIKGLPMQLPDFGNS